MPIHKTLQGDSVAVKIWTNDVDELSMQQLERMAALPFIYQHIAAMPDVHLGKGATVGSVIATRYAIIPAAVGVDLGCGMCAVRTSLTARDLDEKKLQKIFNRITRDIPVGMRQYDNDDNYIHRARITPFVDDFEKITQKHPQIKRLMGRNTRWDLQMGSLGGGNHFIEICLDENQQVWIMLHSGSRGVGNAIGSYFIEKAREEAERQNHHLPDKALAWLGEGSPMFNDYIEAVGWAQAYAAENRAAMLGEVVNAMQPFLKNFKLDEAIVNCHHNYVARETHFGEEVWVTRKGAIRAGAGEFGIIPGSMGARSYIVTGKGEPDSFMSSAHGAGRRMSRNQAAERYKISDLEAQTKGVVCRKDRGVLDEIPAAYKNIDKVMANQNDLVEVRHTLKQVLCVKG